MASSTGVITSQHFVHNISITQPSEYTSFDLYALDDKSRLASIASQWVVYYTSLLADLENSDTSNVVVASEDKNTYKRIYTAELQRYINVVAEASNLVTATSSAPTTMHITTTTAPAAVASTSATTTTTAGATIKANLPSKFNGRTDLQLFLQSMETYFAVVSVPPEKQAGVLRLNLSDSVHTTLNNTSNNNDSFWQNKAAIITTLTQLYERPNKSAAAQQALKTLTMKGYDLQSYFNKFVTLVGQAGYDANNTAVKTAFCQGLNNMATRGGLRTQMTKHLADESKQLNDIYADADIIMRTEHCSGTTADNNYNNIKCPLAADEHREKNDSPFTTNRSDAKQRQSEWTEVNYHKKRNCYNNKLYEQQVSSADNKRQNLGGNSNIYDKRLSCTRCHRKGHSVDNCNAKTDNNGKNLDIHTTANFKSGLWTKLEYPQKKEAANKDNRSSHGRNSNKTAVTQITTSAMEIDNVPSLEVPPVVTTAAENNNNNSSTLPAATTSFGLPSIGPQSFANVLRTDAAVGEEPMTTKRNGEVARKPRPPSQKQCKSTIPIRLHMWMILFTYIHVLNTSFCIAEDEILSALLNNNNTCTEDVEYTLDFDTLQVHVQVNALDVEEEGSDGNHYDSKQQGPNVGTLFPPRNADDKLTYCPHLMEYIIKIKNNNEKLTALFDPGSGCSAIRADKVKYLQTYTSPYTLHTGLAATNAVDNTPIDKINLNTHVNINYKIGNFSDNYPFRVFPNLQADMILGLDWIIHHNPIIPDWSSGIMHLIRQNKNKNKSKTNTFKIKPVKPIISMEAFKNNNNKQMKNPSNKINTEGTGLISALEVSQSTDWDCLTLMIKSLEADTGDEFYKPHFEEPPLYTQSEPLNEQQLQLLQNLKAQNHEVLRLSLPAKLPPHRPGDSPIAPIIPGAKPVKRPAYQLSPSQNLEIKKQLTAYIDKGYLQPSHSPWGAPVFLVKKPHSDQWRMICDWRGLNKITIKDRFEIPNPAQLFDKLGGSKWFTKLDLAQGYHQIPLSEDDRIKSAIVTRYGSYEWNVASFGMTNVPSVFQRVLGNVLFD